MCVQRRFANRQYSLTPHFTIQKKPTKLTDKKEIKQRFSDATISRLPLPQMGFFYIIFFLSESVATKGLQFLALEEKCLAQVQTHKRTKSNKNQSCPSKLIITSHFCIYYRTFHLPIPLSDEGKCQETVEDSPLLWTFPAWWIFWYDGHINELTYIIEDIIPQTHRLML